MAGIIGEGGDLEIYEEKEEEKDNYLYIGKQQGFFTPIPVDGIGSENKHKDEPGYVQIDVKKDIRRSKRVPIGAKKAIACREYNVQQDKVTHNGDERDIS